MPKLIVILGATGNQGGSVAARFLQADNVSVRGLTRDPSSPRARRLASQGVEIVRADVDDVSTLLPAFAGASLIFSVTDYWEPFFAAESRARAASEGVSCREYAGRVEARRGRNIADAAAATVETLDECGFVASTLSCAGEGGRGEAFAELYHFDAKAAVFPGYVRERWPALAAKMACVQTGFFMSSYKLLPQAYFGKVGSRECFFLPVRFADADPGSRRPTGLLS